MRIDRLLLLCACSVILAAVAAFPAESDTARGASGQPAASRQDRSGEREERDQIRSASARARLAATRETAEFRRITRR